MPAAAAPAPAADGPAAAAPGPAELLTVSEGAALKASGCGGSPYCNCDLSRCLDACEDFSNSSYWDYPGEPKLYLDQCYSDCYDCGYE